jgi:hypothetical protein
MPGYLVDAGTVPEACTVVFSEGTLVIHKAQ